MNLRVKKLQEEIFRASKSGNFNKSNDLMKKLVKSESAKLLAIYIITQKNKGKSTPGIDGVTYLTPESRIELKLEKNKTRALGIMTIKDRVMAKIISFALMAKWEALFESNVLGFRPGKNLFVKPKDHTYAKAIVIS
jgi:RNA-directed DNA polymerase